jgi:Kdo2-lipid IVA lauroyltransferase/acyltransferase
MGFLKVLSRTPLALLYALSNITFAVSFYLLRYRRQVVQENLRNSFPEKSKTELHSIEKEFYKNLSDYAVETLKLLTISKSDLSDRVVFKNPEVIQPYTSTGHSVLLLASHQFNWEWLLAAGSFSLGIPIDFVYQPQSSKRFNDFSLESRSRFGAYAIKRETVGREAIKRKHIVRGTAIVADQFPGHFNFRRYWTAFLNQRTAFFHGISQLMVLTQSPVFFAAIRKIKRGYYEVELILLATPPYQTSNSDFVIDEYVKQTEKIIRAHPEGWLWSHKRWKELDVD